MCSCTLKAGEVKAHTWPCNPTPVGHVAVVDVLLDVGYYIHVMDQSPLVVTQDRQSINPYRTYSGCKTTAVTANFNAELRVSARATSLAIGLWTPRVTPRFVDPGTTDIKICVTGRNVNITRLNAGRENVRVAELRMEVIRRP